MGWGCIIYLCWESLMWYRGGGGYLTHDWYGYVDVYYIVNVACGKKGILVIYDWEP